MPKCTGEPPLLRHAERTEAVNEWLEAHGAECTECTRYLVPRYAMSWGVGDTAAPESPDIAGALSPRWGRLARMRPEGESWEWWCVSSMGRIT